jgi:hypothetical protein
MHHIHMHFRFVGGMLLALVALLLAACTSGTAQQPPAPSPTAAVQPPASTQPPSTPVSSFATPAPPPAPTSAPPAPTQPPALVGPEWTVAYAGDLNGDGVRDVVAYMPAALDLAPEMQRQPDAGPDAVIVSELVIVQAQAQAQTPHVQASVSPRGVEAADTPLLGAEQFGTPGPAAFLVGVDPQAEEAQVQLIPLDATGNAYGQGVGLYWNEGQQAYRLFVGGQAVPPPNVPDGSTLPRHTPLPSETHAPDETEIVLYWVVGETVQPEYRRIQRTSAIGTAALELLLAGPQQPGLSTAIPTPAEVQTYPGRQPDWGERVRLLGLTIEDGVATANFSQEMQAYGGGSARVQLIREQITQTLLQFPTVQEVRIAVEGEVDTALQP